jgi:hypothetical protein
MNIQTLPEGVGFESNDTPELAYSHELIYHRSRGFWNILSNAFEKRPFRVPESTVVEAFP